MSTTHYQNYNENQNRTPNGNDMEEHFNAAKSYMLSTTTQQGVNLYDHLVKCVSRFLTEQPRNGVTIFEDVSRSVRAQQDTTEDQSTDNAASVLAEEQKTLFEKADNTEELDDEALQSPLPNILEQAYYFEQAGIGLERDETYQIWLAIKRLIDKGQFDKLRFWGKIFGTEKNYYIAEAEQNAEDEGDEDEGNEEANENEDGKDVDDEEVEGEEDPLPKSTYKAPPAVPKEERGTGVNKHTYYVCNHPGGEWIKLPTITPAQIAQARQIRIFFSGNLNQEIKSYPTYPGTEKNYLRAQIARISATTHVSPEGRFKFSDEEEESEEEGGRQNYQENEEFTGTSLTQLIDEDLSGWVHHVLHILPQGRTKWWNPNQDTEKEEEEADEEEETKGEAEGVQPEQGPPLLTSIGTDADIQNTKAWTAKISSNLIPQYACAFVRSNLWPGAYAFARGIFWENIYVGYGHKYSTTDYKAEFPPLPADEYSDVLEIVEIDDPTPEDEAKARAAEEQPEEEEEHEEEAENEEED